MQVTGDDHVPAGRRTWHAQAAPLVEPWSREERDLVDLRDLLVPVFPPGDSEESEEPRSNVSMPALPSAAAVVLP